MSFIQGDMVQLREKKAKWLIPRFVSKVRIKMAHAIQRMHSFLFISKQKPSKTRNPWLLAWGTHARICSRTGRPLRVGSRGVAIRTGERLGP